MDGLSPITKKYGHHNVSNFNFENTSFVSSRDNSAGSRGSINFEDSPRGAGGNGSL